MYCNFKLIQLQQKLYHFNNEHLVNAKIKKKNELKKDTIYMIHEMWLTSDMMNKHEKIFKL